MDLSIIIVSWNASEYLRRCLVTVARETQALSAETIVVDNHSADGSCAMVRREYPWVRLIENADNFGFAKGNNVGIAHSSGRYLALINSDVELEDGCLRTLLAYMDNHTAVGLAGPRVLNSDRSVQRSCRHHPTLGRALLRAFALDRVFTQMAYPPQDRERAVDVLSGCFWFARRTAVEQVGGLDEDFFMYSEDVDWCRRFTKSGWPLMYVPTALAVHHGGVSSDNAPIRFYIELYRANFQYCRKHHGVAAETALKGIALLHHSVRVIAGLLRRVAGDRQGVYKTQRSLACISWILRGCPASRDRMLGKPPQDASA